MTDHPRESFDLNRLLLRWAINAAAIWAAITFVPGITPTTRNDITAILVIALVFGLLNAIIRPILMFLTCPLILLTLGLGTLLINTLLFALAGELGRQIGYGFRVEGFWPAFWGALVVSIISAVLSTVLGGRRSD
jgi:putative membrane protein